MKVWVVFFVSWVRRLAQLIVSGIGVTGSVASIAGVIAPQVSSAPDWLLFLPVPILITFIAVSRPKFPRSLYKALHQELSPDELLDLHPEPDNRFGLLGNSNTGKSTFRLRLALKDGAPQSNRSVAQIFSVRRNDRNFFIALVDSVGERLPNQFQVAQTERNLLMFIDHAAGQDKRALSKRRLVDHKNLFDQILIALNDGPTEPTSLTVVQNKHDLWGSNASSVRALDDLSDEIGVKFKNRYPNAKFHVIKKYSNYKANSLAEFTEYLADV
mgnify:CR=1 FL=1